MKLVKTFLRNSVNEDQVSDLALQSIESSQMKEIDLQSFVKEFDSHS